MNAVVEHARIEAAASAAPTKVASREELVSMLQKPQRVPARLGELLLSLEKLKPEQRDVALQLQRNQPEKRIGEVLTELGMLQKEELYRALCEKLGVPYVDVARFDIDPNALKALPDAMMRADHVLPLCFHNGSLVVAVPDALDSTLVSRVRFLADCPVTPVMATADEIARVLGTYFGPEPGGKDIQEIADQLKSEIRGEAERELQTISDTDNTLVRLVNKMILDAYHAAASDIHVECDPGRSNVLVRFRKDGELAEYLRLPHNFRSAIVSRLKIMAELDISEHRHAQDGRINFRHFGPVDLELRVVTMPTRDGLEDVVMRLLAAREPLPISELGMPPPVMDKLRELIAKPYGLILAVGPTGSGKTTTLHSLISLLNKPGTKIWTAENPIEITQAGLRQVQVNPKIGWTFATVMRAFLRADPDVIMVGEMRDKETAGIAVEASLTGHLVFSTLHTNSAAETVVRLLDMGIDPFSFSDSLLAVLAQRLVRRLCPACRSAQPASAADLEMLAAEYCYGLELRPAAVIEDWQRRFGPELQVFRATGCPTCRETGYRGRIGVYELLSVPPEMRPMMLHHASAADLQRLAVAHGMRTLKQDGIEKSLQGITDMREVHAVAM